MRILFIGDVIGRPGRDVIASELPSLKEKLALDFVVSNAENAAGGFGLTRPIANELFATGIDVITTGNHWADQKEILGFIGDEDRILRPINYPQGTPGRGAGLFETRKGERVLVLNPMGRVHMDSLDDPFRAVEAELAACPLGEGADAIVVDMHAEATSEKMAIAITKGGSPLANGLVTAGKGKKAEEVARLAKQQDVEVREDPELLSRLLGGDQSVIPNQVYELISEIISFTFEVDDKTD